jgi:C4-dicarboxylate transporter DctM subunit
MSPEIVGILMFGLVFILMFAGTHLGVAIGIAGIIGLTIIDSFGQAAGTVGISAYSSALSYDMVLIPIFLVMGELAFASGLSVEAFDAGNKWIGHLPGGLAMATVAGCSAFAAVSGSSAATMATMATVALPEMRKRGYEPTLSTGALAAGGTLGILIPPSGCFVLYGIITEQSIGKLFIAGILPGLLLSALFILSIYIVARRNPSGYPPAPKFGWRERLTALMNAWGIIVLFLVVVGGIYLGICTANEAASLGAFIAFLIAVVKKRLTTKIFFTSITNALVVTAFIFLIIIGAKVFNVFFAVTKIPVLLASFISAMNVTPLVFIIALIVLFLILGCIMDAWAMLLLMVPVLLPSVKAMGFDFIWFGVFMVIMVEAGMITPPVGMNVFILSGQAPDVPMYKIFKGCVPFLICMLVCVALLIAFPDIALILPRGM